MPRLHTRSGEGTTGATGRLAGEGKAEWGHHDIALEVQPQPAGRLAERGLQQMGRPQKRKDLLLDDHAREEMRIIPKPGLPEPLPKGEHRLTMSRWKSGRTS